MTSKAVGETSRQQTALTPIERLQNILSVDSIRAQFENALRENAGLFIASIIDLYSSDKSLQQCDPSRVVMEAMKAATLKLPINRQLGFAYIVPYNGVPQFQLGYRGYIQLAMRTGQYRYLNAGVIHEGVHVHHDILTGELSFSGQPTSDKPQGYFAHMELLNGFRKTVYMTHAEVLRHAKRYSKSFGSSTSAWQTHFDEMAQKTVLRRLLSRYGILSADMITALTSDTEDVEDEVEREIEQEANKQVIDVKPAEAAEERPRENERANGQKQMPLGDPGF